jgi:hypothetical protein
MKEEKIMASEDITFCANKVCNDMKCYRNPKHIKHLDIPHSFALFRDCSKWREGNAKWLTDQLDGPLNTKGEKNIER